MPYWHMDAAMAALLILQTAVDEGLGRLLLRDPAGRVAAVRGGVRGPGRVRPDRHDHAGSSAATTGATGSPRAGPAGSADEVVHRGRW